MNTYFKIITLLILFISLSAYAQKPEIKFEHLSRKEGLSQSTVYAILQDSKGFMWFGTQDGLNKYDGYTFTHYRHNPQNPDSLSNSFILSIYEDRSGTLWVGTDGGGLDKYDRHQDKFVHYRHDPKNPESLSGDVVLAIYEDSAGILWISTYEGGLNKFDRQQDKFVHYRHDPQNPHSLSSDAVWPIYEDSTGTLWVGADSDGLNKFDREQNQFVRYRHEPQNPDSLSGDKITAIYEDKTGKLWIGTDGGGLNWFAREQNKFVRYQNKPQNPHSLSNDTVWSIYEDSTNKLWIGTDGGLNQFDREQNQFMHYLHDPQNPNSLSSDYVMKIYQDRAGALWIGTDGGSLNKFDPQQKKFVHYFHEPQNPNTLSHNTVSSIYEDSTGALWVGTLGGGLNQFDHNRAQVTHYRNDPQNPDSLSHDEVWSIYEDRTGMLWIGTFGGGLNKFDRQQNKFVRYLSEPQNPNSLSNDKVSAIYEDKTGTLWIGTREGLNKFDREQNTFVHYRFDPQNPDSLSEDSVLSIYEDRREILWIGTQGGGLNKLDRQTGKFVHYLHNPQNSDSISHNEISAIYEDKTGGLWIATLGGGLNQFDQQTKTFTYYREQDGLANDVVYGILEDNKGYLWLSTNKGLSKFDPKNQTFRNYDVLDGLQSNEFRAAYHKSHRGELFFGGINGFNGFYPARVKDNPYIPPIVITDFKIFNKSVTVGKSTLLQQHISVTHEITLSYKQSFFSVEFAALNFLQPTKNKYMYKLEGLDKDWNEIGTRRNAYYTSVPHGTYVFRVKGSNNDGLWNEQGAALKITVLPPPWKTWWAYTLYIITILAIILNYVRVQRQKLREKQQELEREKEIAIQLREADRLKDQFLANTSHELRTPLNGIIGIVESLIDGAAGPITTQIHANLAMVAGSGRRLNHLVNDILDFSKLKQKKIDLQIKSVDMHTIAEVVLTLVQPLIGHKKVQLINAIPSGLPPINADENRVQQILCNLVGNAIKFTDSGRVEISAEILKRKMEKEKGDRSKDSYPVNNSQLENWLAITVSDTGIGIPAKKLHRIFEAFEQADGSTSRIYGGTGLGLAVTQQLVQLHGGELCVQSQLGMGSQFTFTLPLSSQSSVSSEQLPSQLSVINDLLPETEELTTSQSSLSSEPLPETEELTTSQPSVSREPLPEQEPLITSNGSLITEKEFTVLVVDDEPVNRQVLVNYLSLQNYTIHQAASGIEALAFLEKGQKPDIILLDVMMPQKNGYEVTRIIRETWSADELPIILLTAKNQVADLVAGLESGANDYLTKPFSKDELLARIKTHLHILRLKVESLRLAIENKNRLTQFLESVPVGIVIFEVKGTFFYLNQRVQQILGMESSESLSTIEQLVLAYPFYIAGTEQPYPTAKLPFVQALDGKTSTINNVEIHQADKIIPLEICGTPIFDEEGKMAYVINTLQDITERKTAMEAQENLRFTKELFQLNQAYERFVPREFLSLLDKQSIIEVNFGDHVEKEMTIMFADIRGFTTLSENLKPQEIFDFINAYLSKMEPLILEHHGIIDKYIGDAIMALFPTSADDAINGAIAMLKALTKHNKILQGADLKPMQIGIGLNTGPLMLGTVGGQNRMDGTVIADAVNVASRVEGLTKIYGTPLLITEQTYLKLADPSQYHIRVIDAVKVKGKSEEVTVYEIFDAESPEILALKDQTSDDFETGFALYHWEEYQDALPFFESVLQINENDDAAQVYLERCQNKLGFTLPPSSTLLIVDDSPTNIRVLFKFLTQNNLKILTADCGTEALQVIQYESPHLILLDVMMPDMDGFETCRRLKANSQTHDIPIIFMSALVDTVDKAKGFELGAVDYITKPFQLEEVLARINTHLKLSYLQQQLQARNTELESTV